MINRTIHCDLHWHGTSCKPPSTDHAHQCWCSSGQCLVAILLSLLPTKIFPVSFQSNGLLYCTSQTAVPYQTHTHQPPWSSRFMLSSPPSMTSKTHQANNHQAFVDGTGSHNYTTTTIVLCAITKGNVRRNDDSKSNRRQVGQDYSIDWMKWQWSNITTLLYSLPVALLVAHALIPTR